MFNALNRFISRLDGEDPRQKQQQGLFGFQVLRNTNEQLAIEPWFDFIVGINGRMIDDPSPALFAQEVRNCAGGTVTLGLWSAKGQRTRTLHVPVPADAAPLQLTLQWTPLTATAAIWHVLDVPAASPADAAGLLPYSDYILGSPDAAAAAAAAAAAGGAPLPPAGEGALAALVEAHLGRPLRLWVYNAEYDVTRALALTPRRAWGGDGALGCVLGFGALHRLPPPLSEPVDAPGELLFDGSTATAAAAAAAGAGGAFQGADPASFAHAAQGDAAAAASAALPPGGGEFMLPAQLASGAPPPPLAGSAAPRSQKKKANRAAGGGIDDYFNEQEQKSRELDRPETTRSQGTLAPPPKAGGPPPAAAPAAEGPPKAGPPRAGTPKPEEAEEGGEEAA